MNAVAEVFVTMLRLGTMAFGGPVAHLAHFERELIEKKKWASSDDYADLIAFCQFLPGPASSQVGMGLGRMRGGFFGMLAAWAGFSLPSVALLLSAAAGLNLLSGGNLSWLHGLMAGVVAIVADAVVKMGRKLCPTPRHASLAAGAAILMLLVPGTLSQLAVIGFGAAMGSLVLPPPEPRQTSGQEAKVGQGTIIAGWAILLGLVLAPIGLSWATGSRDATVLNVYASFAQTGALVFGGGHVVLPMLQAEVVDPGWLQPEQFLAGYGITQAMPGPIFTLSSYLGSTIGMGVGGGAAFFTFAAAAFFGIFMPSFGFIAALFPLWHRMRSSENARRALAGINAAVVGLLTAALYDPVWIKAMHSNDARLSVAIVIMSWLLLVTWKRPAWQVVIASAVAGAALRI